MLHPHTVLMSGHWSVIEDHQNSFSRIGVLPLPTDHAFIGIIAIHPLKSL